MSRKRKIGLLVGLFIVVAVLGVVASVLLMPWGAGHWPQVPAPELYVATQPKQLAIVGAYELNQQTITTNGLAFLGGKTCQLDLRADGSFAVTNYPRWSPDPHPEPHVAEFISTTGRWQCAVLGAVYVGKHSRPIWGIKFPGADMKLDSLSFRGTAPPYGLMMTYGDADSGEFMLFQLRR